MPDCGPTNWLSGCCQFITLEGQDGRDLARDLMRSVPPYVPPPTPDPFPETKPRRSRWL